MRQAIAELLNRAVVLDTDGPIVYLGRLVEVAEHGFWLADADLHDCRDGHATKEQYVAEAHLHGYSPNRRRVFVMRSAVISVTPLDDVIVGEEGEPPDEQ